MKLSLISALFIVSITSFSSFNTPKQESKVLKKESTEEKVLTVYNVAEYIDPTLLEEFEEETGYKVNYLEVSTLEEMYNQVTMQPKGTYDLLCPSEYMIQKLVNEDLIIPLDKSKLTTYYENTSTEIHSKLENMKTNNGKSLADYTAGYMWGTMGLLYDPNYYSEDEVKSWDILWDNNHYKEASIKNSMRDTYVVGILHAYKEELKLAREEYLKNKDLDSAIKKYNDTIQSIFNLHDEENIEKVKQELISLRKNIYGFEVDSGKTDIIDGKIKMNLAWSGDAVYSIYEANDTADKELKYYVPDDGSNIWYDGWVITNGSKNVDIAYEFINFVSRSENAARNMSEIGYTPFITGEYIFDQVSNEYGATDYDNDTTYVVEDEDNEVFSSVVKYNNKFYKCIKESKGHTPDNKEFFIELSEDDEFYPIDKEYDLDYYFHGTLSKSSVIYPFAHKENKLYTQYPDVETINRCAFMNDFGEDNSKVIIMWGQVKASTNMTPYYIIIVLVIAFVPCFFIVKFIKENNTKKYATYRNNRS